jgi:hypothetical protein
VVEAYLGKGAAELAKQFDAPAAGQELPTELPTRPGMHP